MQVKKIKNKERSMYHHGLIKMLVEHELHQKGQSWNIFLWENGFISKIEKDNIQISPSIVHQEGDILPPRRITRAMNRTRKVQEENEKEKEARVPSFKRLQRKSRKYSTSSIGIDQYQKKFYDHLLKKEQRDKHPIFEKIEDHINQEDFVSTYEQEDEITPEVLAVEVHSPIPDQVVEDINLKRKSRS